MAVRTIARSLVVLLLSLVVPAINLTQTIIADRIVIEKSARTMKLMRHGEILKTYKVALSRVPAGAKERTGDHKVPEGEYIVDSKNAQSRFHRALHISYPNATDRERARKLGVAPGRRHRNPRPEHNLLVGRRPSAASRLDRWLYRRN